MVCLVWTELTGCQLNGRDVASCLVTRGRVTDTAPKMDERVQTPGYAVA